MRRILPILLALALSFTVYAQTKPRLAVLPFTGGTGKDGETIATLLSYRMNNAFTVIPRTGSVEAIMKEQQFQRSSGLTDSDTIARLGRQYNADLVVAGHIQKLEDRNLVLITIINVESLQQIAGDYREYQTIEEMETLLPYMAKRIIGASRTDTSGLPRLAVLPFAIPQGVNTQDAEVLAQLLATEIANRGKYAVLPRTESIQRVMEEQKIQRSGLTDPDSIKAVGRAVNARYVLSGNVRNLGATNMFTAEILNIEDGSQVTGNYRNYRTIADGLNLMTALSYLLTGGSPVPENFVRIPGGTFIMGSPASEADREDDEVQHQVTVSGFYMGKYEVTQKEWIEVMGNNPSRFEGDNLPVENVSWYDAIEYCNRRSQREGLIPAYTIEVYTGIYTVETGGWTWTQIDPNNISEYYNVKQYVTWNRNANGYRLPTEAEWEYACRAGTTTPFHTGNNVTVNQANYNGNPYNGTVQGQYRERTWNVGSGTANAWGLYDMHGNVWEWCWDWYGDYVTGLQYREDDWAGKVVRGGTWDYSAQYLRSANRGHGHPYLNDSDGGFRLVRPLYN